MTQPKMQVPHLHYYTAGMALMRKNVEVHFAGKHLWQAHLEMLMQGAAACRARASLSSALPSCFLFLERRDMLVT